MVEPVDDRLPTLWCQAIYQNPSCFDKIFDNGDVYLGLKRIGNDIILACRGSDCGKDWWHDAESIAIVEHPQLGFVGKGFIIGIDDIFDNLLSYGIPQDITLKIYGHSLGGAHAAYLAGLFIKEGYNVELVVFESPNCCSADLRALLNTRIVRCYRNLDDFVTTIPPFSLKQPGELIKLDCPPVAGDITLFRYHHMPLIVCAVSMRVAGLV